mgnify:CR=1 FL=1|tara:strand:+ start:12656 stop:12907 length:252 start_codon:yes stop_codon:yes gene_type:complete
MKRIQLTETELTRLIYRVINEAETANCKCCDAGVQGPEPGLIGRFGSEFAEAVAREVHSTCCKGCTSEQGGMISNDGIRRVSR